MLSEGVQTGGEITKKRNDTSSVNVLPSVKNDLEYVKPLKISQNQYEDPRKCSKCVNLLENIAINRTNQQKVEKIIQQLNLTNLFKVSKAVFV